ncbi:MAG: hypothetical protein CMH49_10130 [Myxococcales bacterium]|nr:hypothetical protein [Myxococcales bacterium]
MSLKSSVKPQSIVEKNNRDQAQKVLVIAQESPVSLALSNRLARLGLRERFVIDKKLAGHNYANNRELFLGDWYDPMTLLMALQEVQGVFVDLSSLPSELYLSKRQEAKADSEVHNQKTELSKLGGGKRLNRIWQWNGLQALLAKGVKELLGSYKPPTPSPSKHSTWKKEKGITQKEQSFSLDQSLLSYALLNSSLSSFQSEKPLTFLVPSVRFNEAINLFLNDETLASYQLAGWRTNIIFYDWFVSDLATCSSVNQQTTSDHHLDMGFPDFPGFLTPTIEGVFTCMAQLKSENPTVFNDLLDGQSRLHKMEQTLSLVDLDDLISVALIVYQTQVSGERYLLNGDRLTWSSLMQVCAHLIDPLSTSDLDSLSKINPQELSSTWQLTQLLKKVNGQPKALKEFFKSDPLIELNQRLEGLLQSSTGGALIQGHGFEFSALPHQFSASPIITVLADKLQRFLATSNH